MISDRVMLLDLMSLNRSILFYINSLALGIFAAHKTALNKPDSVNRIKSDSYYYLVYLCRG